MTQKKEKNIYFTKPLKENMDIFFVILKFNKIFMLSTTLKITSNKHISFLVENVTGSTKSLVTVLCGIVLLNWDK